jgi:hypothetical protein
MHVHLLLLAFMACNSGCDTSLCKASEAMNRQNLGGDDARLMNSLQRHNHLLHFTSKKGNGGVKEQLRDFLLPAGSVKDTEVEVNPNTIASRVKRHRDHGRNVGFEDWQRTTSGRATVYPKGRSKEPIEAACDASQIYYWRLGRSNEP